MITEISPIFGLMFMGIMEVLMMIAGFGSFSVAFVIWRTHRGQKKIESARLLIDLRNQLKDEPFATTLNKLHDGKSSECDDKDLHRLLNHLEMVAGFSIDGLINERDFELFIQLFAATKQDKHIQKFMKKVGESNFPSITHFYADL